MRLREVSRMSCCARVIRSRVTNCSGVIPVACLNTREKWKGLKLHQFGQRLDGDLLSEMLAHVILHFAELPNGQATVEVGLL